MHSDSETLAQSLLRFAGVGVTLGFLVLLPALKILGLS